MAYLGLARKWRPQTFDDLVGQQHIALTLSNAIKSGRINQGYLFTGTRGVGKTSAARIFAKALRCPMPVSPGVPCNQCGQCLEISEGRANDVLEIDGASNNGVDAVREIRENVKYLPASGKYKIYIIDEVHMLTTAAFNALLKTLEEPPPHVLFIFATTDPQKIPATVLSRCQRFDFKRVAQRSLQERIEKICRAENVSITTDALAVLSREAEGSMRDAVSLLDQALAVCETGAGITGETLAVALGLVDKKTVLDCVTGILRRQPLDALEAAGRVHLHGFDLKQFGREVLRYLRLIMVARLLETHAGSQGAGTERYLDVADTDLDDIKPLLGERSLDDLDMLFRMLNHGLDDVARSAIPKTVLDVLLIKASATAVVSLSAITTPSDFGGEDRGKRTPELIQSKSALPTETPPRSREPRGTSGQDSASASSTSAFDWKSTVAFIKAQKPLIASVLEHLSFEGAAMGKDSTVIRLGYGKDSSFYKEQIQAPATQQLLAQLLKNHLGCAVRLEYKEVLLKNSLEEEQKARTEERRREILESEAIKASQQLLGAKVEKLELRGDVNP